VRQTGADNPPWGAIRSAIVFLFNKISLCLGSGEQPTPDLTWPGMSSQFRGLLSGHSLRTVHHHFFREPSLTVRAALWRPEHSGLTGQNLFLEKDRIA
jgi:hypothetical protein